MLAGLLLAGCSKKEVEAPDVPVTDAGSYMAAAQSVTDLGFRWILQKGCL